MTKFDEKEREYYLGKEKYWSIAEKYTLEVLKSECIFEVNTGLITRGFRSLPCPHERLLYLIAKNGGKVTCSSDAHDMTALDSRFSAIKKMLKTLGFRETYTLKNGEWIKNIL